MNRKLLELDNVSKNYVEDRSGSLITVLSGVSLEISAGDSVSVSGPSGSGKSTLLNITGALDRPSSGRVIFRDEDISGFSDSRLSMLRNKNIGFIFQMHHLLPQCTVMENILVPTIPFPSKQAEEYREDALRLLDSVGLRRRSGHKPAQLSGGERQRAAVARALINDPDIILADEPTGSLDRSAAQDVADLILGLNRSRNKALVIVTHADDLAEKSDKKYELRDGRLLKVS